MTTFIIILVFVLSGIMLESMIASSHIDAAEIFVVLFLSGFGIFRLVHFTFTSLYLMLYIPGEISRKTVCIFA